MFCMEDPPTNRGNLFLTSIEGLKGEEGARAMKERNITRVVSMGVNWNEEGCKDLMPDVQCKFSYIIDTVEAMGELAQFLEPNFQFIDEELSNPKGLCFWGVGGGSTGVLWTFGGF